MDLKILIIERARELGINPYIHPFKPSDLGIRASNFGSFSDYCAPTETESGKWNRAVILKVAEWTATGRPYRYVLIQK